MINPIEIIDKATDVLDDNIQSQQEIENERTERLELDMASDNQLSKMIRPIITIYSGLIWGVVNLLAIWFEVNDGLLWSVGGVFSACIGFYFNSKRQERITEKKNAAAIKLEMMKTRADIRQEKRLSRKK